MPVKEMGRRVVKMVEKGKEERELCDMWALKKTIFPGYLNYCVTTGSDGQYKN